MKTALKIALAVMMLFTFTFAVSGTAVAKDMVQTKCPIMGYKPNEKLYADYKGKRIYFCCASCPDKFKQDPDKYMQELEEQGVKLEDAPSN